MEAEFAETVLLDVGIAIRELMHIDCRIMKKVDGGVEQPVWF